MNLQQLGEFGLIEHLQARLQTRAGVLQSIGDDAAVLASLSTPVVTCDALIEGVHFRRDWTSPFLLGRKAMAVNLSDLAASGAKPVAAFICLGVSTSLAAETGSLAWLEALYDGFQSAADEFDFTLAGGDTVSTSEEIMLSITMIGEVENACRAAGAPILRSGAQPGDAIFVTGTLGDSAAGLFLLQHPEIQLDAEVREYLLNRHLNPTPRLHEMRALLLCAASCDSGSTRAGAVSAALDLSDGLAGDAAHIARRSKVQLKIETAKIPISPQCHQAARATNQAGFNVSALNWATSGGEDYELLLCAPTEFIASKAQITETLVTQIGICHPSSTPEVLLLDANGQAKTAAQSWTHF